MNEEFGVLYEMKNGVYEFISHTPFRTLYFDFLALFRPYYKTNIFIHTRFPLT
jgi:phosphate starvation-inducible membrane PsiE